MPPLPPKVQGHGQLLTQREYEFVQVYIQNGGNGAQAIIDIGGSQKYARQRAWEMLQRPHIRSLIKHTTLDATSRLLGLANSSEAILMETAKLAFANPKDMFDEDGKLLPIHLMSDSAAAMIQKMDVEVVGVKRDEESGVEETTTITKVGLRDKISALKLLGSHTGVFVEKKQVNITVGLAERMSHARARRLQQEAAKSAVIDVVAEEVKHA